MVEKFLFRAFFIITLSFCISSTPVFGQDLQAGWEIIQCIGENVGDYQEGQEAKLVRLITSCTQKGSTHLVHPKCMLGP